MPQLVWLNTIACFYIRKLQVGYYFFIFKISKPSIIDVFMDVELMNDNPYLFKITSKMFIYLQ